MRRISVQGLLAGALVLATGCGSATYVVNAEHQETKRAELDAEWFTREIRDGGTLVALELVYCPIQPNTETVCRTATVWEKDRSVLMDLAPTTVAPHAPAGPPRPATPPPVAPQPRSAEPAAPPAPPPLE